MSSGRSATSGSRLFCSIRSGASVCQLRAVRVVPRGARTGRAPSMVGSPREGGSVKTECGGGEQGTVVDQPDDGLDLGGEVAVGAGAVDARGADGIADGAGGAGWFERCPQVDGAGGGEDLDGEHAGEAVDRPPEL